jgi:cytochrome c peroxidase
MISLISDQSKYDRVMRGDDQFTDQELRGYNLFKSNCASCHTEPLFTNYSFASNGISATEDSGRARITMLPSDRHQFKVPTLRNVEYSKPYMHDGRYKTLREMLHHYASLNQYSPNQSNYAQNTRQELSDAQQTELLAFLLTLSDSAFIYNPNFSYPFEILHNQP